MTSCRAGLKYSKIVGFNVGNVSLNADTSGTLNPNNVGTSSKGGKSISIIDKANPKFTGEETSIVNNPPGGALNHNCTL